MTSLSLRLVKIWLPILTTSIIAGCAPSNYVTPPFPASSETIRPTATTQSINIPTSTSTSKPTEVPTEVPTKPLTLEPTTTEEIDFPIPDAPQGVDPEKWREAYISGMQTNGYLKLKVQAGLVETYWDQKLNTLIWDLGEEKFGYNQEFGFTGDVVGDIYGKDWIVREKLYQTQSAGTSIWTFDNLHVKNENQLIMGTQCDKKSIIGPSCAVVGQIVGRDTVDFSKYLLSDYFEMSSTEKGKIYESENNFMTEILRLRVPNINGFIELIVPVCPVNYCDSKITKSLGSSAARSTLNTGFDLLNNVQLGEMIYIKYGIITNKEIISSFKWNDNDTSSTMRYFIDAFGTGKLLELVLIKYFNTSFGVEEIPDNFDGTRFIFDLNNLSAHFIVEPASVYFLK